MKVIVVGALGALVSVLWLVLLVASNFSGIVVGGGLAAALLVMGSSPAEHGNRRRSRE